MVVWLLYWYINVFNIKGIALYGDISHGSPSQTHLLYSIRAIFEDIESLLDGAYFSLWKAYSSPPAMFMGLLKQNIARLRWRKHLLCSLNLITVSVPWDVEWSIFAVYWSCPEGTMEDMAVRLDIVSKLQVGLKILCFCDNLATFRLNSLKIVR